MKKCTCFLKKKQKKEFHSSEGLESVEILPWLFLESLMVPSWCYCPGVSASASAEQNGLCVCVTLHRWIHIGIPSGAMIPPTPSPHLTICYQGSFQGSRSVYTNLQVLFTGSEYFRIWGVFKYNQSSLFNYFTSPLQCMLNFPLVFCYCR